MLLRPVGLVATRRFPPELRRSRHKGCRGQPFLLRLGSLPGFTVCEERGPALYWFEFFKQNKHVACSRGGARMNIRRCCVGLIRSLSLGRTTMPKISTLFIAVAGLIVAVSATEAAPINKCIVNGTITYQQGPCPSNQVRKDPTIEELNAAEKSRRAAAASAAASSSREDARAPTVAPSRFSCDGRQYCSQMKSCEEASYFLANCPGVKMDGDRDGIPCEEQWCSR